MNDEIEHLVREKNNAYWERNQLVCALSKLFPSHLAKHPEEDKEWEDDWRTIVVVYVNATDKKQVKDWSVGRTALPLLNRPFYQLTWHIHDTDVPLFDHLTYQPIVPDGMPYTNYAFEWDGHSTEEKYRRLRTLPNGLLAADPAELREEVARRERVGYSKGDRNAREIVDRELRAERLEDYERNEVLDELQQQRGYPKGVKSREVVSKIIQTVTQYHRKQIENTHTVNDGEGHDFAGSEVDKRISRL